MNKPLKNSILAVVVALIVVAVWYLQSQKPARINSGSQDVVVTYGSGDTSILSSNSTSSLIVETKVQGTSSPNSQITAQSRSEIVAVKSKKYTKAKEFVDVQSYINSPTFKLSDIVGKKVVYIDFWTYSCINCQRTTPYLKTWYDKYERDGLVIIGIHTPEFQFEKEYTNVLRAVKEAGITYPVIQDNNYGTWSAYENRYWPHGYLIDIDGFIVYDHIGEGGYDKTEKEIQKVLTERAQALGINTKISSTISVPGKDDIQAGSPEVYFGANRNEYLVNGKTRTLGIQNLSKPQSVLANKLYLSGSWNFTGEYAETTDSQTDSNRIQYLYTAKSVYFVAGANKSIEVEVLLDNKAIDSSIKGKDIFYKNGRSYVRINDMKLYSIIEAQLSGQHLLEFIVPEGGLQAYTFTFG